VKPYLSVVNIDLKKLPSIEEVRTWDAEIYTATLRHDAKNPCYNPHFRQFMHVAFKIAAKMGQRYTDALKAHADVISRNVMGNLLERHIRPLFG
jgi:hypothetical protein